MRWLFIAITQVASFSLPLFVALLQHDTLVRLETKRAVLYIAYCKIH